MNLQAPGVSIEASASKAEPGRAFALDAPSPCFPCRENDKARHEDSQQKCRTFVMIEVGVCVCVGMHAITPLRIKRSPHYSASGDPNSERSQQNHAVKAHFEKFVLTLLSLRDPEERPESLLANTQCKVPHCLGKNHHTV